MQHVLTRTCTCQSYKAAITTHHLSSTLQQDVCNDGVAVGTGVGEGGVHGVGLGVDTGTPLDQELDDVHVTLLRSLHERRGGSQLNISTWRGGGEGPHRGRPA